MSSLSFQGRWSRGHGAAAMWGSEVSWSRKKHVFLLNCCVCVLGSNDTFLQTGCLNPKEIRSVTAQEARSLTSGEPRATLPASGGPTALGLWPRLAGGLPMCLFHEVPSS